MYGFNESYLQKDKDLLNQAQEQFNQEFESNRTEYDTSDLEKEFPEYSQQLWDKKLNSGKRNQIKQLL